MKTKNLLILALLAGVLPFIASCSNDELVAENQSNPNEISFKTFVAGTTRASSVVDVTTANLTSFTVNAMQAGTETAYFSNAVYTGTSGGTFTCTTKHYWPAVENLDFYAYAPAGNGQVTYTSYKAFTVTPTAGTDPASQVDLVYAATKGKSKSTCGASGVTLNFRHTGAKIVCKVKNTSTTLKFGVEGWKVGYLSPTGTFTFADTNTDGQNTGSGTTLTFAQWGSHTAASVATEYASTFSKVDVAVSASETGLGGEMILVPQTLTAATAYANSAVDATLNGTFIAVKLYVLDNTSNFLVAGGGSTASPTTIWAIWPIGGHNWEPGKKYTYTIDLAGAGYYEKNTATVPSGGSDTSLDPILEGAEIKFVTVTVDDWTDVAKTVPES